MKEFKKYFEKKINESAINEDRKNAYDLESIGGGWNGDTYIQMDRMGSKGKTTVSLGLYSGGNNNTYNFGVPKKIQLITDRDEKFGEELKIIDAFNDEFAKDFIKLLKEFDNKTDDLITEIGIKYFGK